MSQPGSQDPTTEPWWQQAVFYQVYVRSFADGNGDGVGDLAGITSRLPYLRDLGVDALWVTPFYTSPQHDHGYDVADYLGVDPLFGSLDDADVLIAGAHEMGLRVVVDLVPNHTSSDHAWFQAALTAAPGSPERARYLFRDGRGPDGDQPPNNWRSVFGGPAWDRVPGRPGERSQWYLHLFDSTQPDLDWRNPEVGDMFEAVLRFWLDRGADGFRVDVAHGLVKEAGLRDQVVADGEEPGSGVDVEAGVTDHAGAAEWSMVERTMRDEPMWDQPEVHDVYRRWHAVLAEYAGDRMTVAEAWTQTPDSMARYVRSDEMSQAFNFAWLLAPWSAEAFAEVVTSTFDELAGVGATPTWVLSNHDVVRHATRYGGGAVGLARARAATLAMLALPGSAYLYQGEELGLENVDVPPEARQDPAWLRTHQQWRDGCRVPIPWSGDAPPYGFSAGSAQPWLPQPEDWKALTVQAQTAVTGSTLELYRAALSARRTHALGAGDTLDAIGSDAGLLTFRRGQLTVVLNAGRTPLPLPEGEVLVASGDLDPQGLLPPDTTAWVRR